MMKNYVLLMVIMFMSGVAVNAQKKNTDANPCKLINEKFSADSIASFNEHMAVKYKLLPSIKESGSCLEIRIYDTELMAYGKVLIIKSVNDSIVCDLYSYFFTSIKPHDTHWKFVGDAPWKKDVKLYLASRRKDILQDGLIDKIKDSGIFTITPWKTEFDKLKKNNQYESGGFLILDPGYTLIEVKLGNKYRKFDLGLTGNGTVNDEYLSQLKKIFELIALLRR